MIAKEKWSKSCDSKQVDEKGGKLLRPGLEFRNETHDDKSDGSWRVLMPLCSMRTPNKLKGSSREQETIENLVCCLNINEEAALRKASPEH